MGAIYQSPKPLQKANSAKRGNGELDSSGPEGKAKVAAIGEGKQT
jgi:hypothetical protein